MLNLRNEQNRKYSGVFCGDAKGLTISCEGKTIRCTAKMGAYENPLHIISAHMAELGITFTSQKVDGKSNEIPALRQLLETYRLRFVSYSELT